MVELADLLGDDQSPLSETFETEDSKSSNVKITHKYTLGDTKLPCFCVRYDYNDKYIAGAYQDGSIKIFNVFTQKASYILNEDMEDKMPTTNIRWRPLTAPGVTKNVMIAVNAHGDLKHYHTTSGKVLSTLYDSSNTLITCDYRHDGEAFLTAGYEKFVRIYDEQTRKLVTTLQGGGSGLPGHSNRITCAKFVAEDKNLVVSGGWDESICIWDVRSSECIHKILGVMICGDSIDIHDGFILSGQYRNKDQLQLHYIHNAELAEKIPYNEKLQSEKDCQIFSCQFQKNTHDLIIAGGSGSNEVKVFDGDSAQEPFEPCFKIKNLSRPCLSVDFSNSGDMFACAGGDGVIRVFNVANDN